MFQCAACAVLSYLDRLQPLAVPLTVTPLTSLRYLNLSHNDQLGIDGAGLNLLRSMKGLRLLDAAKRDPAVHAASSTQGLLDLVKAFANDQLLLHINVEPDLSETYEADEG